VWSRGGDEATTTNAEQILQNCRLADTSLEALATAVTALAHAGEGDRAEQWCASLSQEAGRRGAVTWQAMIDAIWSGITLRRGDIASAIRRAQSTVDMLGENGWGVLVSYPLTTLLIGNTVTGAYKAAAEILLHPVPDAMFDTIGGLRYLRARGHYHLSTNRVLAAVSDFQLCRRLVRKWDVDRPALLPWRTDLAEANLRLGEPRAAAELAKQQLDLSPEIDAGARGAALRILALTGEPARRVGLLHGAAEQFKASGDRLELGHTARALNQVQRRSGDTSQVLARPTRETAVRLPTVDRVVRPATPAKPASAKAQPAEPAVLSESEMRVAQLAALGHTNRQIANTLFITMSTVEQHLTKVYRKLGVPGRSELPGDLAPDLAPRPAR
jgi:DNA-binding CsgD family transcriptional regulator